LEIFSTNLVSFAASELRRGGGEGRELANRHCISGDRKGNHITIIGRKVPKCISLTYPNAAKEITNE
jgi:hypothetical protein